MIRRLLPLLLLLWAAPAAAQLGSVPHEFVSGTTILAADVNENFDPVFANALNRTGGTMTGLLTAQQITPAATNTYSLGVTGTRFQDLFLSRDAVIGRDLSIVGTISDSDSALNLADQVIVTSTAGPQFQVRYDGSNLFEVSVSSTGATTINATGAGAAFTLSDALTVTGALNATSFGAITTTGALSVTSGSATVSGTAPFYILQETDAGADAKYWRFVADAGSFTFQTLNDALSVAGSIFSVARSGSTVTSMTISAPLVMASTLSMPLGAAATPSLTFTGDSDTGIYSPNANQIAVVTGGTNQGFYMSNSGVQIGSSTQRVDMTGSFALQARLFATLGVVTPTNGDMLYCSDCTIASPCASGGSGAIAKRLNSVWVCN